MVVKKRDNLYVIYVYKHNIDIFNIDDVVDMFKRILIKLKKKYDIRGLCYIDVYVNNDCGMIIEIENIYKGMLELDVKINFHIDTLFISEINYDIYDNNEYEDIYYYHGKYYTNYKEGIDSNIIYKDSLNIINNGIKIK